ncbi:MAG TPA: hypothetical protein VLD38_07375 [Nitrosopumilaceae archaeon]|nr:hypothetical protein [Nitrosopumilaceae archaeon]
MSELSIPFCFDVSDDLFFRIGTFASRTRTIIAAVIPTIIGIYFFGIIKNAYFSPFVAL